MVLARSRSSVRLGALVAVVLGALALGTLGGAAGNAGESGNGKPRGLVVHKAASAPGSTLFAPLELERTYLIDERGRVVHTWKTSTRPGLSQYLLPNGHLLRAGNLELKNAFKTGAGAGGRIEELDWDGNVVWRFDDAGDRVMQHHDIEPMPNGNVLIVAWERKNAAEALAAGRLPELLPDGEVWPDTVVEYSPSEGRIVWEWHVWDHLVQDVDATKANFGDVQAHPEKIDANHVLEGNNGDEDWNHVNGVDYNAERDEIMISSRSFSEFWIVDHAPTTEAAKGAAGDLLFRYGNPATIGAKGRRTLFVQHEAAWIPEGVPGAGNVLVFNNGLPETRAFSTVDQITPALVDGEYVRNDDGTSSATISRVYPKRSADKFFAAIISGAERLPNGNTLITDGTHGRILETTPAGAVVWEYENPYYRVRPDTPKESGGGEPIFPWWMFRSSRYAPDYPGLALLQ
jgi:Arylsulfotransferase (ASST)